MFRYLWLRSRAEPVGDAEALQASHPVDLRHHHFEAATDTYYEMGMYDDIHVGALLQYMHRFSGMYHSISQVAYYHNPCYQRRKAPMSQEEMLRDGRTAADAIPVLQQLYPEVKLLHEDMDMSNLPGERWCWIHAPGRIWLLQPGGSLWWDPSPLVLVAVYLKNKQ